MGMTCVRRIARVRMAGMMTGMTGMTGMAGMVTWMMARMMTWVTGMWWTVVGRLTVVGIIPVQRRVLHGLLGVERDLRVLEARLGIQALDRDRHGPELGIVGRRWEVVTGCPSRKIRYQVEMLACRCRDAEGLLHKPVGLVPVAVGFRVVDVVLAAAARVGGLARGSLGALAVDVAALALHLPVRQEAARHATGAPRFAVGPPPHAGLLLVPDEHGPGADALALLFREPTLDAGEHAYPARFKELDGIGGGLNPAVVGLHGGEEKNKQGRWFKAGRPSGVERRIVGDW